MMRKFLNVLLPIGILVVAYLLIQPMIPRFTVGFVLGRLEESQYEEIFSQVELSVNEEALLRSVLESASYEIVGSRIEGDRAYVSLELTVLDMQELVLENHQQLLTNALGNLGNLLSGILGGDFADTAKGELVVLLQDDSIARPFQTRELEVVLDRQFLWFVPNLEATLPQFEALMQEEINFNIADLLQ